MSGIGILLILLALLLSNPVRIVSDWRNRALLRRFGRLVPRSIDEPDELFSDAAVGRDLYRLIKRIDPTFSDMESALRILGYGNAKEILAIQGAKVAAAFVGAILIVPLLDTWDVRYAWLASPFVFLVSLVGLTQLIKGEVRQRRRQLGRELAAAIDLVTIFLEGGQSLEQALRALSEMAGPALPTLAGVQRTLITDLDNGVSFDKALDRWAGSFGSESAEQLATLFKESLLHGTELVPQLRRFRSDLMDKRLLSARESIGRKSAELTMVMVVFFLPTILIFIGAPAFVGLFSGLRALR